MIIYFPICFQDQGDSDSEEEQIQLSEYERILRENDPDFRTSDDEEIPQDSPQWYQLHLATERIKVPEILFQVKKKT